MLVKTTYLREYLLEAKLKTQEDVQLLGVDMKRQNAGNIIAAWRNMGDGPLDDVLPDVDDRPLLPSGQDKHINHIIIYPGAFNPPHRGHVDTLQDGFLNDNLHNSDLQNKGPNINIVAAIVAPTGDDRLRTKEAGRNAQDAPQNQVILSQKHRVSLFKGHLQGSDNYNGLARKTKMWKFPYLDPFEGYLQEVKRLAGLDGFEIEFLSLKGPDHLFFDKPIMHPTYPDCKTIMFTEATRRAGEDIWEQDGRPKNLVGAWSPWSNIGRVRGRDGAVWESTLPGPEGSAVRLLTDQDKTRRTETSSTAIRNLITNQNGLDYDSLVQELRKAGVFDPETLLEFNSGNRQGEMFREDTPGENTLREKTLKRKYLKGKYLAAIETTESLISAAVCP